MTSPDCPTYAELEEFIFGNVGDAQWESVDRHLQACSTCSEKLDEFEPASHPLREILQTARRQQTAPLEWDSRLSERIRRIPDSDCAPDILAVDEIMARLPTFAGHRINQRIGSGAMGVVYLGTHLKLKQKKRAIKVIADRYVTRERMDRFEREIDAIGSFEHENIVKAVDAGIVEAADAGLEHDMGFLIVEYVDGVTVLDLLRRQPEGLSISDACQIAMQAAKGLQHSGETHGILHRDIKPSNLMIAQDGTVKIIDYGLASFQDHTSASISGLNQVPGTRAYMAPERFSRSSNINVQSDIFSLGVTLYEMLTGQRPFRSRDTDLTQVRDVTEDEPPRITNLRRDVPDTLANHVHRMIAHNPQDRFETPNSVANALEPFSEGANLSARAVAALPDVASQFVPIKPSISECAPTTVPKRTYTPYRTLVVSVVVAVSLTAMFSASQSGDTKSVPDLTRTDSNDILPRGTSGEEPPQAETTRPDAIARADELSWQGWHAMKENDLTLALRIYKETLELDPTCPRAHLGLGFIYRINGRFEEASTSYDAIITNSDCTNTFHIHAFLGLGDMYRDMGNAERSNEMYKKAVVPEPIVASDFYCRTWAYYWLGQIDNAKFECSMALNQDASLANEMPREILGDVLKETVGLTQKPLRKITNSIGMTLLRIENCPGSRPFYLGEAEVTVAQFRKFAEQAGMTTSTNFVKNGVLHQLNSVSHLAELKVGGGDWESPGFPQTDDHPVVAVSGVDAMRFAEWLSDREGRKYRLPSVSEWKYVARAAADAQVDVSDSAEAKNARFNCRENSNGGTTAIKSYPPDPYGFYDIIGNAAELTTDPLIPAEWCRIKGGSFRCPLECLQPSYIASINTDYPIDCVGFRILCEDDSKIETVAEAESSLQPSSDRKSADLATELAVQAGQEVQRKNVASAYETYKRALAINNSCTRAHCGIAWIYWRRGDYKESLNHYTLAIENDECCNSDLIQAYYGSGDVYRDMGDDTLSCSRYEKALAVTPEFSSDHLARAWAYFRLEKLVEANNECEIVRRDDTSLIRFLPDLGDFALTE